MKMGLNNIIVDMLCRFLLPNATRVVFIVVNTMGEITVGAYPHITALAGRSATRDIDANWTMT